MPSQTARFTRPCPRIFTLQHDALLRHGTDRFGEIGEIEQLLGDAVRDVQRGAAVAGSAVAIQAGKASIAPAADARPPTLDSLKLGTSAPGWLLRSKLGWLESSWIRDADQILPRGWQPASTTNPVNRTDWTGWRAAPITMCRPRLGVANPARLWNY